MQASPQLSPTTMRTLAVAGDAVAGSASLTPPDSAVEEHFPLDARPPCHCGRPIIRSQLYRMERRLEECCYSCATRSWKA